ENRSARRPATSGPDDEPASDDIWYPATAVPPRPPMTSPTTAALDVDRTPDAAPNSAIPSRNCHGPPLNPTTRDATTANPAPARRNGRRPRRSTCRPTVSSTAPSTAAQTKKPAPVHRGLSRSDCSTNNGTTAERRPNTDHPLA